MKIDVNRSNRKLFVGTCGEPVLRTTKGIFVYSELTRNTVHTIVLEFSSFGVNLAV